METRARGIEVISPFLLHGQGPSVVVRKKSKGLMLDFRAFKH